MEKKGCNWLLGCGIGCALIIILILLLIGSGAFFVRDTMKGFNDAVESRQALDQQFGDAASFTPPPDGRIPADRMEAFLSVREATQANRTQVAEAFSMLPTTPHQAKELEQQSFGERMKSMLKITSSAFGLGGDLGEFFAARNQAMLEAKMGMGEYSYIYALAYHVWLQHPTDDGSSFGPKVKVKSDHGFERITHARLHRELLGMLRNQLAELDQRVEQTTESMAFKQALEVEIEAMESDDNHLPWRGALPAATAESLAPYRDALEATYHSKTNAFELARNEKRGNWSIRAE